MLSLLLLRLQDLLQPLHLRRTRVDLILKVLYLLLLLLDSLHQLCLFAVFLSEHVLLLLLKLLLLVQLLLELFELLLAYLFCGLRQLHLVLERVNSVLKRLVLSL